MGETLGKLSNSPNCKAITLKTIFSLKTIVDAEGGQLVMRDYQKKQSTRVRYLYRFQFLPSPLVRLCRDSVISSSWLREENILTNGVSCTELPRQGSYSPQNSPHLSLRHVRNIKAQLWQMKSMTHSERHYSLQSVLHHSLFTSSLLLWQTSCPQTLSSTTAPGEFNLG